MTPLEQHYRRLLRLLPADYRQRWEEDMVATYLDEEEAAWAGVEDERERELAYLRHPPLRQVVSVLALAVRLHLAAPAAPGASLQARQWGQAVRQVARLGLLLPAATALNTPIWSPDGGTAAVLPGSELLAWRAQAGLWLLAYLLLATGQRRWARVFAPLALAATLVESATSAAGPWILGTAGYLISVGVPVIALLAWHGEVPAPSRRELLRWLLALPAAAAGLWVLGEQVARFALWTGPTTLLCLTAVGAAVVAAARRSRTWSLTALLLAAHAGAAAGLDLANLIIHSTAPIAQIYATAHVVAMLVLLLLVVSVRRQRRA
ncbi:hypothetical protein GCM10023225_15870 [Kineococcus glutinatus]|uniref:Membrane protein DUF2157 n=2 Tax=Kineococcus glutinatus TaxID=1070872 RepID=A0ABP9HPT6_9ACTN